VGLHVRSRAGAIKMVRIVACVFEYCGKGARALLIARDEDLVALLIARFDPAAALILILSGLCHGLFPTRRRDLFQAYRLR
jgi:hypothetical protein